MLNDLLTSALGRPAGFFFTSLLQNLDNLGLQAGFEEAHICRS